MRRTVAILVGTLVSVFGATTAMSAEEKKPAADTKTDMIKKNANETEDAFKMRRMKRMRKQTAPRKPRFTTVKPRPGTVPKARLSRVPNKSLKPGAAFW